MSGKLIVLEGIDGAGTTTQSALLAQALAASGHVVHQTREPSDGPVGRLIREHLRGEHGHVDWATMALLFAADRVAHCRREVYPALLRGSIVVCDRWLLSSLAYQANDAFQRQWVRDINSRVSAPDLTIYLDVAAEIGAARRCAEKRSPELYDDIRQQHRVADNYRRVIAMCTDRGERIAVVDGSCDKQAVAADVLARVQAFLGEGPQ